MDEDLRNHLDRLADRTVRDRDDDPIARLDGARRRRAANRRIGALVLALAVAIAGTATAMTAFDDDGHTLANDPSPTGAPAWTPLDVLTVWPENPVTAHVTDPRTIQRWVDRGDAELQWRTDPEEVVRRFAAVVLGWSDVTAIARDVEAVPTEGVAVFDITPCPPASVCDLEGPAPTVYLVQPASSGVGGIWSVQRVRTDGLWIRFQRWNDPSLSAGRQLAFEAELPVGTDAHIGVVASNGCRIVQAFDPGRSSGTSFLEVPTTSVEDGCSDAAVGYAFTYAQASTTVPVGDPLLESATIDPPYLTIAPVVIDLAPPEPIPRPTPACAAASLGRVEVHMHELELITCSRWPAETPIELRYRSYDPEIPYGLALYPEASCDGSGCDRGASLWQVGPSVRVEAVYRVPALEPGGYLLVDPVHPVTTFAEIDVRYDAQAHRFTGRATAASA